MVDTIKNGIKSDRSFIFFSCWWDKRIERDEERQG